MPPDRFVVSAPLCNISILLKSNFVMCVHERRRYRISRIDWEKSPKDTFLRNGKAISYADYLKDTYNEDVRRLKKGMLVCERTRKDKKTRTKVTTSTCCILYCYYYLWPLVLFRRHVCIYNSGTWTTHVIRSVLSPRSQRKSCSLHCQRVSWAASRR